MLYILTVNNVGRMYDFPDELGKGKIKHFVKLQID